MDRRAGHLGQAINEGLMIGVSPLGRAPRSIIENQQIDIAVAVTV